MNPRDARRGSQLYVIGQNILLVVFVGVVFLAPKNLLFQSDAVRMAGNLVCACGVILVSYSVVSLRRVIQIAPLPKSGGELVQRGPYKYLRHPIYTGMIFCVVGLFLRTPTVWIGIASLTVIVFLFFKARFEETLLFETYPDYENYRRRTWGLFPGLG